jgi:hypothetical protein
MIVRIRLTPVHRVSRKVGKNRHLALAVGGLLTPAAVLAYVLAAWCLAADLGVAGSFAIRGVFSHWQLWIAGAVLLSAAAFSLNRYADAGEFPRLLGFRAVTPQAAVSRESDGSR